MNYKYYVKKMQGPVKSGGKGWEGISNLGVLHNRLQIIQVADGAVIPEDWIIITELPEDMLKMKLLLDMRNGKKMLGFQNAFPHTDLYGVVNSTEYKKGDPNGTRCVKYTTAQNTMRKKAWLWWIENVFGKDKVRMGLCTQEELDEQLALAATLTADKIRDQVYKPEFIYDTLIPPRYYPRVKYKTYENTLEEDAERIAYLKTLADPEKLQEYIDSWKKTRPVE